MGVEVNIRVELPVELAEHVSRTVEEYGDFESIEAYVEELIRRDMEAIDEAIVGSNKAELQRAFATPDSEYTEFDVEQFLDEAKRRRA